MIDVKPIYVVPDRVSLFIASSGTKSFLSLTLQIFSANLASPVDMPICTRKYRLAFITAKGLFVFTNYSITNRALSQSPTLKKRCPSMGVLAVRLTLLVQWGVATAITIASVVSSVVA